MQIPDPIGAVGFGRGLLATRRRRRVGPAREIRETLLLCQDGFQEIIDKAGAYSTYFDKNHT